MKIYFSTCVYAGYHIVSLKFNDVGEAKIAGKVAKHTREWCIVLLQSNVLVALHSYLFCAQEQGKLVNMVAYMRFISLPRAM